MINRTLCIIMGGGRGTRMYPLTKYRSKPAVPLGAKYRLIDIPISNCLNSGLNQILVLTQYNSESLNKHIIRAYPFDPLTKGFVEILAASQSYEKTEWFQGTADSVRQSLPHIHNPQIDRVIVLSGDQLYKMDLRAIENFHLEKGADITVACHPIPVEDVHRFGIMDLDDNHRISSFHEKPKDAAQIRQKPVMLKGKKHYLANMGIYVFHKKVLTDVLTQNTKADFGREIIPDTLKTHKVFAFVHEGYWSDIGTIGSYYEANIMLTDEKPLFNLHDEAWQIYTRPRYLPPAKMLGCKIENSMVAEGGVLQDAEVRRSVIGVRSSVRKGTRIHETMIAGNDFYEDSSGELKTAKGKIPALGIGPNCVIQKAIIDKNVRIGTGVRITNEKGLTEAEGEGYTIRDGIVVVHKGAVIPDGTVI